MKIIFFSLPHSFDKLINSLPILDNLLPCSHLKNSSSKVVLKQIKSDLLALHCLFLGILSVLFHQLLQCKNFTGCNWQHNLMSPLSAIQAIDDPGRFLGGAPCGNLPDSRSHISQLKTFSLLPPDAHNKIGHGPIKFLPNKDEQRWKF